jgi:hypothetical protein
MLCVKTVGAWCALVEQPERFPWELGEWNAPPVDRAARCKKTRFYSDEAFAPDVGERWYVPESTNVCP